MGYIKEAQKIARVRLVSHWTIPLRVFCFMLLGLFWYGLYILAMVLNSHFHPAQSSVDFDKSFRSLGVVLPLFFAALVPAFISGNFVAWIIPPIRKSLDMVGSYKKSQAELWRIGKWVTLICLLVSLICTVF